MHAPPSAGLFAGHGTQKLFGWFGEPEPEPTGRFTREPAEAEQDAGAQATRI